ncbi:MAG: hypothetical protein ACLQVN_19005 [Bryobacteraceae bacterium]
MVWTLGNRGSSPELYEILWRDAKDLATKPEGGNCVFGGGVLWARFRHLLVVASHGLLVLLQPLVVTNHAKVVCVQPLGMILEQLDVPGLNTVHDDSGLLKFLQSFRHIRHIH